MAVRAQAEKRSFEVAMEASRQNPGDSSGYVALGQYGRILSTYLKHFPHTQLLTLFTEDLEKQPHSSLDAIVRYLGLEARFTRQFREAISRRRNAPAVFLARPYGKASLSSLVDVETIAGTAPKSHSFLVSNRGRHSLCTFRSNGLESASPTGGVLPK
jgi:hypothetical protein